MRVPIMAIFLYRLDGAEQAAGKVEERGDEFEYAADCEADEAEGKQDQPDQRIEQEREQRQGPADDEKNAEQQELEHKGLSV
jgi:hypothetical protein